MFTPNVSRHNPAHRKGTPHERKVAISAFANMLKVYLPLASSSVLAGGKTSAVIKFGTATLAALIGAGGLGEPIISGLNLNDHATHLERAIPVAILALLVQFLIVFLERFIIPKGLQLGVARK